MVYKRDKVKTKVYRDTVRLEIRQYLKEYKKTLSCLICGESHPACVDFHHRDPSTKLFPIARAPHLLVSIEKLTKEIAKCDVLCCNCHRKTHRDQWSYPIVHPKNNE